MACCYKYATVLKQQHIKFTKTSERGPNSQCNMQPSRLLPQVTLIFDFFTSKLLYHLLLTWVTLL